MKLFESTSQKRRAIIAFLVLAATVLFAASILNIGPIVNAVRAFFMLFSPFYIGFVLSYLLNPLLRIFENKVFKKIKRKTLKRVISVIIVYLLLLAFVSAVFAFVIPSLISSVVNLVSNFQSYYELFTKTLDGMLEKYTFLNEYFEKYSDSLSEGLYSLVKNITSYLSSSLPKIVKVTSQVSGMVINMFLGFIISVYFLLKKELIAAGGKRLLTALFKDETANKLISVLKITDIKTGKFIVGRIIDSMIMTVLCFIFMSLFRFPFPLLNSFIVGVFNLVPVFGSIVSAIPTAFIVLITKPSSFIWYIIFIIVIQQFDGNILGPKIQGSQLGISALWIMFSVLLFGGLFGVGGMIIGVPLFAVIYYFLDEALELKLVKKGKPPKADDYL